MNIYPFQDDPFVTMVPAPAFGLSDIVVSPTILHYPS